MSERFNLYLKKRRLRILKNQLNNVALHLYFDKWTGKDCIEESNYLISEIKQYEKEIISLHF
tara:strand:- start:871 stop:1056 length:186 start_codon:yes stop_codon:yes gene_type:complete